MADDGMKVLEAYESKFNRLPDQPHHLIAFSKSRSDLPTLSYGKAKTAINAAKNRPKNKSKPKNAAKGKGKSKDKQSNKSKTSSKNKPNNKSKAAAKTDKNDKSKDKSNNKSKAKVEPKTVSKIKKTKPKQKQSMASDKKNKNGGDPGGVISEPMNVKPSEVKKFREKQEDDSKQEEIALSVPMALNDAEPPPNDMQIAEVKSLPSSPKAKPKNDDNEGGNAEGGDDDADSHDDDEEDDEEDALYNDGNETTAPGLIAQMQMQDNMDQFDYVTPKDADLEEDEEYEESVVPDDNQSIASANPLVNAENDKLQDVNGKNRYHPNRHVNQMMAKMVESKPKHAVKQNKIQSLRDWCFDNGLTDIYDKLINAGYTTCKMLSKCRDEQIEEISRNLQFTTPQELTFKVAVEELRAAYLENNYQLRHPEEHRSLTDIMNKISESEKLMTSFYGEMQSMHNEIYAYQMDIEREFNTIIEQLNKRKMMLLNDLNRFFSKKKSIIQMKQQTLTNFIIEAKTKKNDIITMLQDGDIDFNAVEERKQKIIQIHDDVIVKFLNVKKVQYGGFPKANTAFPTTHNMLKEISRFGVVEENIQNTLGVMPVITQLDSNGKDTKIKIKWELTNDHYGIDPDTVKSIRIEWIEVDDDDLQQELQQSLDSMFISNAAYTQNLGTIPGNINKSKSVPNGGGVPISNKNGNDISAAYTRMDSHLMNFAVIQPLHPEVQEQEQKNKNQIIKKKKKKLTLDRWMSKHLDFSLYKAINNEHEINVRKYGKFLVRIKLNGSEQALTSNFVQSNVQSIRVQKMGIFYVKDKFDPRTKHKDLKIGLVNKKILTRAVPGKWRNCFGSTAVCQGVNIWRILLKKMDSNRGAFSCMIGVMDANKAGYMDTNFTEIGGYGMYMNNGNIFHNNKAGMKYYNPKKKGYRPFKNGDVISVIVDYYRGILSYKINKYECGAAWSNINKFVHYKLCVSLRGCDEIKILDNDVSDNNNNKKTDEKYKKIGANIAGKRMVLNKKNKNYAQAASYQKQLDELKLDLSLDIAQDLSLDTVSLNAMAKTSGSRSVGNSPMPHNDNNKMKKRKPKSYKMSANIIRKKSQDIFDKIRRHSANDTQIKNDMKNINIEKNKMKKKSNQSKQSKHKQSRSFFMKNKNKKKDKDIEKLKNLNDESDDEGSICLSDTEIDISQLAAIDDENSFVASSAPSDYNHPNEPNVLL